MHGVLGLVLHIQEGTESGTDAWFHNPASQVSAHFGNPKSGPLDQWVDTADRAWAEVAGNPWWISIENEGHSGDLLTASQLENCAQLLAWLHTEYGVPFQISDTPLSGTPGLTGHGLGGSAWGGHTDCPGAPILAQRSAIITRAMQIAGATSPLGVDEVTPQDIQAIAAAVYAYGREDVNLSTGVMHNVPLGNLAHGAWVSVNDPNGPVLSRLAALEAQVKLLAPIQVKPAVDTAALSRVVAPLLSAGATPDEVAAAVAAHLNAMPAAGASS
jgi:hypothetical protein